MHNRYIGRAMSFNSKLLKGGINVVVAGNHETAMWLHLRVCAATPFTQCEERSQGFRPRWRGLPVCISRADTRVPFLTKGTTMGQEAAKGWCYIANKTHNSICMKQACTHLVSCCVGEKFSDILVRRDTHRPSKNCCVTMLFLISDLPEVMLKSRFWATSHHVQSFKRAKFDLFLVKCALNTFVKSAGVFVPIGPKVG